MALLSPWLRRARAGGAAMLAAAIFGAPAAAAEPAREIRIKAVFLYNFAQFVDWPADAFASPDSPIIIGILGQDPFGPLLDRAVQGEVVNHHPIQVRRFHRVEEIDRCHILYISRSETPQIASILERLDHRSILTVSDAAGFNRLGGMIRLLTESNHVRLRIDPTPARAAGLTISSKLLRPAEVVRGPEDNS